MTYVPEKRKQTRRKRSKYLYLLKELKDHEYELMHKNGSVIVTPKDGESIVNVRCAARRFVKDNYKVPKGYTLTTTLDDGVIWISLEKVDAN